MTHQEIFDKVVTHLFTQGRPAKDEEGRCAYRGLNKTSCAVGCLIPDEKYTPSLEGNSVVSLRVQRELNTILPSADADFLQSLQRAHDRCATNPDGTFDVQDLKRRLEEIASNRSLSTEVLDLYDPLPPISKFNS